MSEFWSNAGVCATQVAVMFVFVLTGLFLVKLKVLTERGVSEMTRLVLWVVNPCMIVSSFLGVEYSRQLTGDLLRSLAASAASFAFVIGASMLTFVKAPADKRSVLRYGLIFSNCGFMALPLTNALFGARGTACVSVFVAVFNLLVWTFGVWLYGGRLKLRQAFVNPGTVGLAAGLVCYFLPVLFPAVTVPSVFVNTMDMASAVNTPLAMMIVGSFLAKSTLRPQKGDLWTALCVGLRLVVIPVATYGLLRLVFPASFTYAVTVLMVPISASVAANTALFASMHGQDAVFASRLVSVSTLLCIVTMPLISAWTMTCV